MIQGYLVLLDQEGHECSTRTPVTFEFIDGVLTNTTDISVVRVTRAATVTAAFYSEDGRPLALGGAPLHVVPADQVAWQPEHINLEF